MKLNPVVCHEIQVGDKEIHLEIEGVDVWVDYDDVDQKTAKKVARNIQHLYKQFLKDK